jgi:hypothetical protein
MAEQHKSNSSGRAFDSQIMPRLEISIPMPPGAAVPAKAPQPQPASPSQPVAARPS